MRVLFARCRDRQFTIAQAQARAVLSVNAELVRLYWDSGRMIDGRQKEEGWGAAVIPRLARELKNELPGEKGFSEGNIQRMLAFYRAYPEPASIVPQAAAQLPPSPKSPQAVAKTPPLRKVPQAGAQIPGCFLCKPPQLELGLTSRPRRAARNDRPQTVLDRSIERRAMIASPRVSRDNSALLGPLLSAPLRGVSLGRPSPLLASGWY